MIPKIIHYCWLSDDPIPAQCQEYIDEWIRLMPDYKIKKWDRSAIDFEQHPFVKAAFEAKKYAFAADYIRVYALYTEGGIYLDSDVKVLKSFDKFLGFDYFTSYENHWTPSMHKSMIGRYIDKEGHRYPHIKHVLNVGIQAAIIGSTPQHPYIESLWNYYNALHWDSWTITVAPMVHATLCESFGFRYTDQLQLIDENMAIFPSDVFCTVGENESPNTHAIHVCRGSWINQGGKMKRLLKSSRLFMFLYLKFKILMRKTE